MMFAFLTIEPAWEKAWASSDSRVLKDKFPTKTLVDIFLQYLYGYYLIMIRPKELTKSFLDRKLTEENKRAI